MLKTYKFQFFFFFLFFLVWSMISEIISMEIILPTPLQVINYIREELLFLDVLKHVVVTFSRVFIGYGTSFILALLLAITANTNELFNRIINQIVSISKTIPTISIILIALIWLGRSSSVYLIAILVVFPLLFEVFYKAIRYVDAKLLDVCEVFKFSFKQKLSSLYMPNILSQFTLSMKQTFGLCFKVMVMAEVLGQTRDGIGSEIYLAKTSLEMAGVFFWTFMLIFIVLIVDQIIDKFNNLILVWR